MTRIHVFCLREDPSGVLPAAWAQKLIPVERLSTINERRVWLAEWKTTVCQRDGDGLTAKNLLSHLMSWSPLSPEQSNKPPQHRGGQRSGVRSGVVIEAEQTHKTATTHRRVLQQQQIMRLWSSFKIQDLTDLFKDLRLDFWLNDLRLNSKSCSMTWLELALSDFWTGLTQSHWFAVQDDTSIRTNLSLYSDTCFDELWLLLCHNSMYMLFVSETSCTIVKQGGLWTSTAYILPVPPTLTPICLPFLS